MAVAASPQGINQALQLLLRDNLGSSKFRQKIVEIGYCQLVSRHPFVMSSNRVRVPGQDSFDPFKALLDCALHDAC